MTTPRPSSRLMRATLEQVAEALHIPGGLSTVLYVFAPEGMRHRLDHSDTKAHAHALAFMERVQTRAEALALVAQSVEESRERVPVPIEGGVRDLVEECKLQRKTVPLERGHLGLRITMRPVVAGRWWDSRSALLEQKDLEDSMSKPVPKAKRQRK